ncbi:hypothetical protein P8605_18610 [Streptomyces sp. T-3]|nr:hypothetical protein [Streptomyces sp. T-3]
MIAQIMEDLAELIRSQINRPVTTDPRNIAAPCVLVSPPQLQPEGTHCGTHLYTFKVLVVGLPGARAEFDPLDALTTEVLAALETGPGWTLAQLVAFEPLADAASIEPSMAYEITVEEYA